LFLFYLAIQQQDGSLSLFNEKSYFTSSLQNEPLENWFGTSIYKSTYPRMPSDHVLSACDIEQ